jgi:hypothetical protein
MKLMGTVGVRFIDKESLLKVFLQKDRENKLLVTVIKFI